MDAAAAADAVVAEARAHLADQLRIACSYMPPTAKDAILVKTFASLRDDILEQEQNMITVRSNIPLFKLPRELRDRIFRLVLAANEIEIPDWHQLEEGRSTAQRQDFPALLHTCRQIRDEAGEIFFNENTFTFGIWHGTKCWNLVTDADELKTWLKLIGKKQRRFIKAIVLKIHMKNRNLIAEELWEAEQDSNRGSKVPKPTTLDKKYVLKALGIARFGIKEDVFRVEHRSAQGGWVELTSGPVVKRSRK